MIKGKRSIVGRLVANPMESARIGSTSNSKHVSEGNNQAHLKLCLLFLT